MTPTLLVDDLTVRAGADGPAIIEHVSIEVGRGEILGVVGESGSGKTTLGLALLGYGRDGAVITGGDILIDGVSMVQASSRELARRRGSLVAYVPQDPAGALNPTLRIGAQLREVLELERDQRRTKVDTIERIRSSLREMGLPDDDAFLRRYPHQLSGGQQQRLLLCLAFLREPSVVVLDEPTTGLDVTTQARVLDTVRDACQRHGTAAVFVTHDLDVVGSLAHRVLVLYAGRLAEHGSTAELFALPRHPYSAALLATAPSLHTDDALLGIPGRAPRLSERPAGCAFAPRCGSADERCQELPASTAITETHVVACHHPRVAAHTRVPRPAAASAARSDGESSLVVQGLRAGYNGREVVHGIDLELPRGTCLAIVGESGSGKTTLSQCIAGLHEPSSGTVTLDGRTLERNARDRSVEDRRSLQYVFQNPYGSLNPRKSVADLLTQPCKMLGLPMPDPKQLLEQVALGPHVLSMRPRQLSGGERQRVAIARALSSAPEFLVCDEITSALDVSIQASVVELLHQLRRDTGIGVLFVTHNLPLVAAIADHVVVMQHGAVVERGTTQQVIRHPTTDYARELLSAVPSRPIPAATTGVAVTTAQL